MGDDTDVKLCGHLPFRLVNTSGVERGGTCYMGNSWSSMIYHLVQACALEKAEGKAKKQQQKTTTKNIHYKTREQGVW